MTGVILASLGSFGDVLNSWEQLGFFSHLLPFLLIFALVFGILSKVNLFGKNRAVNVIIAFVVAIMSLQFALVPQFFSEIFPRVGIGLVIILSLFIIIGLFTNPKSNVMNYFLLGIALIIFVIILVQSAGSVGIRSVDWWTTNWSMVLAVGVILILVVVIIVAGGAGGKTKPGAPAFVPIWAEDR